MKIFDKPWDQVRELSRQIGPWRGSWWRQAIRISFPPWNKVPRIEWDPRSCLVATIWQDDRHLYPQYWTQSPSGINARWTGNWKKVQFFIHNFPPLDRASTIQGCCDFSHSKKHVPWIYFTSFLQSYSFSRFFVIYDQLVVGKIISNLNK